MELKNINSLKYKRGIFSVNERFLSSSEDLSADINYFIQVPGNIQNNLNEFHTLLINLEQTENDLWEAIYHRTRDEINSFLKNQNFEHAFIFPLSADAMPQYIKLYNDFAEHKAIRKAETFRLKAYSEHGLMAVSYIRQGDNYLCVNFYRITKQRASNLYSFHLKHRDKGEASASHYGRAHRALHWLDIKECKKLGAALYDFCGWYNGNSDTHLLGINKFKEQFGGYKVKEYSGVVYKNVFLRILKRLFHAG